MRVLWGGLEVCLTCASHVPHTSQRSSVNGRASHLFDSISHTQRPVPTDLSLHLPVHLSEHFGTRALAHSTARFNRSGSVRAGSIRPIRSRRTDPQS